MSEKTNDFIQKIKPKLKWFFFSFIWLGILMYGLDLLSKQLIVANKTQILAQQAINGQGIILIPNFLAVNYVINHSLAFGISIAGNQIASRVVYCVVASLGAGIITFIYVRKNNTLTSYVKACLMLILAGAIGNLTDRIFYSKAFLGEENGVVDWINFFGIWKFNFNWADSCVVIGVFMLIVWLIVDEIKDYRKRKALEPKENTDVKILSKEEKELLERDNLLKEVEEKEDNSTTSNGQNNS